eukprot:5980681-Amphidinium_carterae.1
MYTVILECVHVRLREHRAYLDFTGSAGTFHFLMHCLLKGVCGSAKDTSGLGAGEEETQFKP